MAGGIQREYTGEVVAVGKQKNGVDWVMTLKARPGMKFPDSIYGKVDTEGMVKGLLPGQHCVFVLDRGNLKKNRSEGSLDPWDYYENLVEVKPLSGGIVAAIMAEAAAQPLSGSPPPGNRAEFRTPEQMIRGVALEHATALGVALIGHGERVRSPEIIRVARLYEKYQLTGDVPPTPLMPSMPPCDEGELPNTAEQRKLLAGHLEALYPGMPKTWETWLTNWAGVATMAEVPAEKLAELIKRATPEKAAK